MGNFVSSDQQREQIRAALGAIDAAHNILRETPSDEVGNDFRVEIAERLEVQERANRGLMYRVFGQIVDPPDESAFVPALRDRLWARLHITPKEITRRMRMAQRIRPRRALTGPPTAPEFPLLAEAVQEGLVGEDHIRAVTHALDVLPSCVASADREDAERTLVEHAVKLDAGIVTTLGKTLATYLNPDGDFDEADRARRRWLRLGRQGPDGMSRLNGVIDPQARAYFEAVIAAVRPGHRQPEASEPTDPSAGADPSAGTDPSDPEARDERTPGQRCHDAFKLAMKTAIASGQLGHHRGLPLAVIATTTVEDLDQAARAVRDPDIPMPAGARTGGGSSLPMRDLISMAANAIHYLAVFDDHTGRPLYLGRQKRLASPDQRLICYARDRGCTKPNCLAPGYDCEVHHAEPWADGGTTDADNLYFACPCDHDLLDDGYYTTEIADTGRLAWTDGTDPPDINRAHHPDELLRGNPDPPDEQPPPAGPDE
ncbi:MAG: HNH endonuclease [Mycobacteriaceae bacterium]|nr:HNH endonuclease [Mycobacteriaceae bacterium]